MKKKTVFAVVIAFILLLFSTTCFANEEIVGGVAGDAIDGTANIAGDVARGTANVAGDIANGVGNTAEGAIDGIKNATSNVANGISNGMNSYDTDYDSDSLRGTTNSEYNATTTGTIDANTFLGMNTTTWWWLIIAIVVILSVFLIWHYSNNETDDE